jgi:hypothetical protein
MAAENKRKYNIFCLPRLHSREETGTRVSIELYTLDINIAVMLWAPELEQDVFARTIGYVSNR